MGFDARIIDDVNLAKLKALGNAHVLSIVTEYAHLMQPDKITVITDEQNDIAYVQRKAIETGEERPLRLEGHSIHFDGYSDQGRDKVHTRVLVQNGNKISPHINTLNRDLGLAELGELMQGIMTGKEMLVRFFCLGPLNSRFSIPALQITDSFYVAHSEDLLYRPGYSQFCHLQGEADFFCFIHSAGQLDANDCSRNIHQRRVYIDLADNRVFSINNQYAGNSLGLKKLALRLAIYKANREHWLAEHMFIMGIRPTGKERVSYFTGAYPSACGKTSTAMLPGQTIVGDDIAYLKVWDDGSCHAVNIEHGIFGIITGVNSKDDPLIYKCLTTPREMIFSNVLIHEDQPYWLEMGREIPETGFNHHGSWKNGDLDPDGKPIPAAHKNARYTIRIHELENVDEQTENPDGVRIDGIIYGGRDSDTNVPVAESLSWNHGVFIGAALESETTAATLGQEGQRVHSPMANLDFVAIPLGKYIRNHIEFGTRLSRLPRIFSTNYFLKDDDDRYLNGKLDKKVWLLWAEGRIHGEYDAIETPIGFLPQYADLQRLFRELLAKNYSEEDYLKQFSIRVEKLLSKLDRIVAAFRGEDMPVEFSRELRNQRRRLQKCRLKFKQDIIPPSAFH